MVGVWAEALGVTEIAASDDFFALGGHSLLVLEAVDAIEQRTGVAIPPAYFFEHPSVNALADYVVENR